MSAPNHQPYLQQFSSDGRCSSKEPSQQYSEVKEKINTFRREIRNHEIRTFRQKKREEMLRANLMQKMLEQMPMQNSDSYSWASDMFRLYSESLNYQMRVDQVVDLFRLVQKFPNKTTFQLLQIVLFKANVASINQIFQYDIMKLLHSSLTAAQSNSNHSPFFRSSSNINSFQQSQIIKEAVTSYDSSQKIRKTNNFYNDNQHIQFTKVILRIIVILCRKERHIRNFVVINHRSFTYCLKIYKQYGDSIKSQFYECLGAFLYHEFEKNEEQERRIENRIFCQFFSQSWTINRNYYYETQVKNLALLLSAMHNLLKQPSGWIDLELQSYQHKNSKTIFDILFTLLKEFNSLLYHGETKLLKEDFQMIKSLVDCLMAYDERIDKIRNQNQGELERVSITFELSAMLRSGFDMVQFEEIRSGIYMMLGNFYVDENIETHLKCTLLYPDNQKDMLAMMSKILTIETREHNLYQAVSFLNQIFENLPLQFFEPLLFPSQIIQTICHKIIEIDLTDIRTHMLKVNLVKILIVLLQKLKQIPRYNDYRQFIYHQYSERICQLMNYCKMNQTLLRALEQLMCLIEMRTEGGRL